MAADLYRASLSNSLQGATNQAIVDFSVLSPGGPTPAQVAAGIVGYFGALALQGVFGPGTTIDGITRRAAGTAGSVPVPFPTVEYGLIDTANGALTPAMTAYGTMGAPAGRYEALGTSVTVSLYTATPGRATTGRHYLPWISDAVNDGNGRVGSSYPGAIQEIYSAMIQGASAGAYVGIVDLRPVVNSATAGTPLIVTPIASRNFARLKTRTR